MNAADKPQPVSGPAAGCGAPLVGSLQFMTLGADDVCDCCHYRTWYDVCEGCGYVFDNDRQFVHGLDPETGTQHLDLCQECVDKLRQEGKL